MRIDAQLQGLLTPRRPRPTGEVCRGRLRPPVAAVLFDIYGTLLVSASGDIGLAEPQEVAGGGPSLDQFVARMGFPPPEGGVRRALTAEIEAQHRRGRCRGIRYPEVVIEEIWGRLYPQAGAAQLRRLALAYELKVNPVWPMPGLQHCLATLHRSGRRLGIVSNAQFYTPLLMSHFLGEERFRRWFQVDLCHYSYRLGQAKPGPPLYTAAATGLARHGIRPEQAVMVGNDRRNDVAAAAAAGFQTVLFAGDARSLRWREADPDVQTVQPNMVVTALAEFADHLCRDG